MISEEEKTEVNPDEQEKTEENKSDKNEIKPTYIRQKGRKTEQKDMKSLLKQLQLSKK